MSSFASMAPETFYSDMTNKAGDEDAVKICDYQDDVETSEAIENAKCACQKTEESAHFQRLAGGNYAKLSGVTQNKSTTVSDCNLDSPLPMTPAVTMVQPLFSFRPVLFGVDTKLAKLKANKDIPGSSKAIGSPAQRKLKIRLKGKSDIPLNLPESPECKENTDPQVPIYKSITFQGLNKHLNGARKTRQNEQNSKQKSSNRAISFGDLLGTQNESTEEMNTGREHEVEKQSQPSYMKDDKGCGSRKWSAQVLKIGTPTYKTSKGVYQHNPQPSAVTVGTLLSTIMSQQESGGGLLECGRWKTHDRSSTQQTVGLECQLSSRTKKSPRGVGYMRQQGVKGGTTGGNVKSQQSCGSSGYYFIPSHLKTVSSPLGKLVSNLSKNGERESSINTIRTYDSQHTEEGEGRVVKKIVLNPQETRQVQGIVHCQGIVQGQVQGTIQGQGSGQVQGMIQGIVPRQCQVQGLGRLGSRSPCPGGVETVSVKKGCVSGSPHWGGRPSPDLLLAKGHTVASPRTPGTQTHPLSKATNPTKSALQPKYLTFETYFDVQAGEELV